MFAHVLFRPGIPLHAKCLVHRSFRDMLISLQPAAVITCQEGQLEDSWSQLMVNEHWQEGQTGWYDEHSIQFTALAQRELPLQVMKIWSL